MKKYTIVDFNTHKAPQHFDNFDDVLTVSKTLADNEIYHIIKDNEFGTSVKMCESYKRHNF